MTKLINSSVYFHTNRHFDLTLSPRISELFPFSWRLLFRTESALRVAKAMTEVWKPGAISNVVAVPHVRQLENFQRLVSNTLPTLYQLFSRTSGTPSNLKIGLKVPKASGKLEKIFYSREV